MKEIEVVLPQEICDGEYEFKSSIDEEYTKGIVCLYEEKSSKLVYQVKLDPPKPEPEKLLN